jgi:hypothetical protein
MTTRRSPLGAATYNAEARTVRAIAGTGAPVRRTGFRPDDSHGGWLEVLDVNGANLTRLEGAPILADHRQALDARLGIVAGARVTGGAIEVDLRLSDSPAGEALGRELAGGTAPQLSIGYQVSRWRQEADAADGTPTYTAVEWLPLEISVVAIAADASAKFRSLPKGQDGMSDNTTTGHEAEATRTAPAGGTGAAERKRAVALAGLSRGMPDGWLERALASSIDIELAREQVLTYREMKDALAPTSHINPGAHEGGRAGRYAAGTDRHDARLELRTAALTHRLSGGKVALPADARAWRGRTLVEIAAECLQERGIDTRTLSATEILERSFVGHLTSDFPALLQGSGARTLQAQYEAAEPALKQIATMNSARDFRTQYRLRGGEYPELLPVEEHAEIHYGTSSEEQESFKLATYARIFALTRQALINDDLGAFTGFLQMAGRAAAELEGRLLVEVLVANGNMADGLPVFDEGHNNIDTSAALSVTSISTARGLLRRQTGLDNRRLNLRPSHLIVPSTKETVAEQIVAPINAAKTEEVNVFSGRLTVVTDSRLDDDSPTQFYVSSDQAPHLSYCYLDGATGPQMATEENFDIMGLKMRCHLDFAAFIQDWRGLVRNAGG